MVALKRWWNGFKTFAIIFSFITNFVLVLVLIFVVFLIFQIKNGIAEPLVTGLHSSFVGLDQARILTTIPVDDTIHVNDSINVNDTIVVNDSIPVKLNIPLQQNTIVTLTSDVPLKLPTTFTLRDGTTLNGTVGLSLPTGLQLPVALNLNVPVDQPLPITLHVPINLKVPVNLAVPIHLKVPVDIPLSQTELHDPFDKLRGLFDPFVRLLGNLPSNWGEVPDFISRVFSGNPPNLLADNRYTQKPWAGFTTGVNPPTPVPTAPRLNLPTRLETRRRGQLHPPFHPQRQGPMCRQQHRVQLPCRLACRTWVSLRRQPRNEFTRAANG